MGKKLPIAAALSLPSTIFLPSAPALKYCPISPLRKKIQKLHHIFLKFYIQIQIFIVGVGQPINLDVRVYPAIHNLTSNGVGQEK